MSAEEQARELMTEQRHHDEHLHEAMLNRAKGEISVSNDALDASTK